MSSFTNWCVALLALVLISSGAVKLADAHAFAGAVYSWRLTNPRVTALIARVLPSCEAALGIALGAALFARNGLGMALFATAALFGAFSVGQLAVLARARGTRPVCGCLGRASGIGVSSISRSLGLFAIAMAAMLAGGLA